MSQPVWKFVANLGDVNPLDYGGVFVYVDETGAYPPEMERLEPPEEKGGKYEVHRMPLEQLKWHEEKYEQDGETVTRRHLIDGKYEPSWPLSPIHYKPWFARELKGIATTMDYDLAELQADLCSDDPLKRAQAYRAIVGVHGWGTFDTEPLLLSKTEARKRYKQGEVS